MHDEAAKAIEEYKAGAPNEKPADIFQAILSSNIPESEKSVERLAQEGFIAIFGGGDPASRAMATCSYFLLAHPAVLERVHQELDALMPNASKPACLRDIEQLPYFVRSFVPQRPRHTLPCPVRLGVFRY
jgi:cytochrome P450